MLADTDQVVREIIDRSKPAATSTRLSMVAVAAVSLSLARPPASTRAETLVVTLL